MRGGNQGMRRRDTIDCIKNGDLATRKALASNCYLRPLGDGSAASATQRLENAEYRALLRYGNKKT